MVSWNGIFTFVIMLVAILAYIDNHRHKKGFFKAKKRATYRVGKRKEILDICT